MSAEAERICTPARKPVVSIDGEVIGEMGCTHPRVEKNFGLSCNAYLAEIDFNKACGAHKQFTQIQTFAQIPDRAA